MNVFEARSFAVDEVIAAAFAGHAASNRDFIELSAKLDFAIGKSQRDLTCGQCFALIGAFEDDVLHGSTAQRFSALLTQHPTDRIDYITLTATIRTYYGGHSFSEV